MMKTFMTALLFVFLAAGAWAADDDNLKLELSFDRQTYRLNEPIPVRINVVNTGRDTAQFMISPLIYETFYFTLKTPRNEQISLLDYFQVEMKDNQSASGDARQVSLMPGESFSRTIDITSWFDIRESGYYFIQGRFTPNPDMKDEFLESFPYKILVKPPLPVEKDLNVAQEKRMAEIDEARKYPPYDVIADLLDAKMKKDWDRFMAHIDTERLINSFTDFKEAYDTARSGRYRLEVLEEFKKYLSVHWQDRILSYKVLESNIRESKATVICDVEFKVRLYSYTLRYTFQLYKNHNNQWLVNDYTALKVK